MHITPEEAPDTTTTRSITMSTDTIATAPVTAADLIGQKVITVNHDGPATLLGIESGPFETWHMGVNSGVTTSFDYVAPADTPIPAKDARVTATKGTTAEARAAGHYGRGSWKLHIEGEGRTRWANTKAEAMTKGLRIIAIRDWHAANGS